MQRLSGFPWLRIMALALALSALASLYRDWGAWAGLPANFAVRVLIVAVGGVIGWLLNLFFGNYVGMATNVIESMGIFRFSEESQKKIENGFIFVVALVAALFSLALVR